MFPRRVIGGSLAGAPLQIIAPCSGLGSFRWLSCWAGPGDKADQSLLLLGSSQGPVDNVWGWGKQPSSLHTKVGPREWGGERGPRALGTIKLRGEAQGLYSLLQTI